MIADQPQDSLYRVTAKAFIKRDDEKVLVVRTGDDTGWTLPGGGVDYGENIQEALQRELGEEVGAPAKAIGKTPIIIYPHNIIAGKRAGLWVLWMVYEVVFAEEAIDQSVAPDGMAHAYVAIQSLDINDVQPAEQPLFIELKRQGL